MPLKFSSLPFSRNETSIEVPISGRYVKGVDPDLANTMDVSMTLGINFAAWTLLFNQWQERNDKVTLTDRSPLRNLTFVAFVIP